MWNTKIERRTFGCSFLGNKVSFPSQQFHFPEPVGRNPKKSDGDVVLSCIQNGLFDVINYVIVLVISIVADGVEGSWSR